MVMLVCLFAAPASMATAQDAPANEVQSLLAKIKAVGKEGAGNVEAAAAWNALSRRGPDVLVELLTGLDGASPRAANWLRSAVDAIAERAVQGGRPLPAGDLEAFVRDRKHAGHARRLAFDWLVRVDPPARDRLLPGMLDDPGAELRREAVDVLIQQAQPLFDKDDKNQATAAYKKILQAARDRDQVTLAADRLKKLGVDVDLTAHFGFVTQWMIIGPFDNSDGKGFHTVFPPEKTVDLKAVCKGKDNKDVRWLAHVTAEKMGEINFNKIIGDLHGATAFAFAGVESPSRRPVEVRAASNNAIRIYLNDKEIYARDEYHHGMQMDQHVGRGTLHAGRNTILVKVCQNEQEEDWAQLWSLQLRLCDELGGAIPFTIARPPSRN